MREGVPVTIDVTNAGAEADIVHWHGLAIDSLNDGAMEEGSPMIAAGKTHRYSFTPKPSGTRWYHTHASAYGNLSVGTYTGQFGFLLIEGKEPTRSLRPGSQSRHPSLGAILRSNGRNHARAVREHAAHQLAPTSATNTRPSTAKCSAQGEPIRVKQGQRVLLRLLNASATENVVLALPGHRFTVIAMDGNPVPNPISVEVLSLAVAERVDAIVEMNSPGVWILGSTLEKSRQMGLGIVVEYAGQKGAPVWKDPAPRRSGTTLNLLTQLRLPRQMRLLP